MMRPMLTGCFTALVTPFDAGGGVDFETFEKFIDWQIAEGLDGVVPVGSTGEAATMTLDERVAVVRLCAERTGGRMPVIAGAGGNDTRGAIETSKAIGRAGATHLLHVSPAYSKPPQRGIIAHFRAIADASPLPVVLYNAPGRTASNMEAETTLALAEHANISGIKEASGNTAQIAEVIRHAPKGFSVLSGDDSIALAVIAAGGQGLVSVVSNAAPRPTVELCRAGLEDRMDVAQALQLKLQALMRAAFSETNPIPIKAALAMMGRMRNVLRLPLVPMDPRHEANLRASLIEAGALAK